MASPDLKRIQLPVVEYVCFTPLHSWRYHVQKKSLFCTQMLNFYEHQNEDNFDAPPPPTSVLKVIFEEKITKDDRYRYVLLNSTTLEV